MVESGKTLIIVLIKTLPTSSGGIQKGVFQLYDNLRDKGFDIEFILDSETEKVSFYEGFKINHLKFPPIYSYPFTKRYFEYLKYRKNVFNYFKKNQLNKEVILIAHWAPDFMLLAELGVKYNFKTVFCFHGPYHTKKFKELCGRKEIWLKKFSDKVQRISQFVFISNTLYLDGIKNCNVPELKSIVINNGIIIKDEIIIKNNNIIKFVMATRLVPNKNIGFVLDVLSILKLDGIQFKCDIYGDGPEEDNLNALIIHYDLEENVILKGYNANIDQLLFKYDYYISASFFEGMPRGPLEAINNNVIPILSDIPTHREITPDFLDVFFSLDDKLSMVKKINEIINLDDVERDSLIKELRINLTNKYDVELRFKKFHDLVKSLATSM